eukprot:gene7530-8368_t
MQNENPTECLLNDANNGGNNDSDNEEEHFDFEDGDAEHEVAVEFHGDDYDFGIDGGDVSVDDSNESTSEEVDEGLFVTDNSILKEGDLKDSLRVELNCSKRKATTWQTRQFSDFYTW